MEKKSRSELKSELKSLHMHLRTVAKFAPQPDDSLPSDSPPETLEVDPCQEQQMAFDGALADVDSAIDALDAALIVVGERMGALDVCRMANQN